MEHAKVTDAAEQRGGEPVVGIDAPGVASSGSAGGKLDKLYKVYMCGTLSQPRALW